jgi:L-histidine N-alpha-methyltransferase
MGRAMTPETHVARARIEHLSPPGDERAAMAAEVRAALLERPLPRIPCKYFYDEKGSALFDEITRLPEYYLTRTEDRILRAVVPSVVKALQPRELFEVGSGTGAKVRLFLDAMAKAGLLERCVLLDISAETLRASAEALTRSYPGLEVTGLVGDFTLDLARVAQGRARLGLFLGSTIGNLTPGEWPGFLAGLAATLSPGEAFLVGLDLVKDPAVLHAAYNDARGVTAAFNRNVLAVLNDRLDADFDPDAFEHVAFFDQGRSWIEMRLRARLALRVRVKAADLTLDLPAGGEIHTEVSCKTTRPRFEAALQRTGLVLERWFTDAEGWFAIALLRAPLAPARLRPDSPARLRPDSPARLRPDA